MYVRMRACIYRRTYSCISRKATICITIYIQTDPRSLKVLNLRKCVKADT